MLVSTEEILESLNDPSLNRHDQQITARAKSVVARLERMLGRHLDGKDEVVTRRFCLNSPSPRLIVPDTITGPNPKLAADPLFEIRETITEGFAALDTVADLELVDVDDRRGVYTYATRLTGTDWPCGDDLVQATYRTGYDHITLPEDLREAIIELVGVWFRDRVKIAGTASEALSRDRRTGAKRIGGSEVSAHVDAILEHWQGGANPEVEALLLA